MAALKIGEGIYSVGALNPMMRVFDVIMQTEYGTSYNSFLVRGESKTALIEACHAAFFDRFLENIEEVVSPDQIDYIVLNHCEPDHSGALRRLLEVCKNATILVSRAGSIYLKNITNLESLPMKAVRDGEELDLGGRTLRFISAPFLHWPDSMFTWLPEERVLFSCDFFGAHFCEPYGFDRNVVYKQRYESAFKAYFDAIFGPFMPYVRKGLQIAAALNPAYIMTSHGPILTEDGYIPYAFEHYKKWSDEPERGGLRIPVFYCSAYGNTGLLAQAIAEGIRAVKPEARVELFDLNDHEMDDMARRLNEADAICIGSPTINADAVPPMWVLLSHVDAINAKKKSALVFGSYGWSGEAVPNLTARLTGLKMRVSDEGIRVQFVPSEQELNGARAAAEEFAKSL